MAPEADCSCHASCNLPSPEVVSLTSLALSKPGTKHHAAIQTSGPTSYVTGKPPHRICAPHLPHKKPCCSSIALRAVVVLCCVQQLGATSSIACSCDWFGCRPPAPGAWECRRTPRQPQTEMHHHDRDRKLVGQLLSRS